MADQLNLEILRRKAGCDALVQEGELPTHHIVADYAVDNEVTIYHCVWPYREGERQVPLLTISTAADEYVTNIINAIKETH